MSQQTPTNHFTTKKWKKLCENADLEVEIPILILMILREVYSTTKSLTMNVC